MSRPTLELLVQRHGDELWLNAPDVGLFTDAQPPDSLLSPGDAAGVLMILGRANELLVPAQVQGRIQGPGPERMQQPVDYGTRLYCLSLLEDELSGTESNDSPNKAIDEKALVLKSPQTGRFYHRSSPTDEPFISPGDRVLPGQTIGMIEVMKTFTTVAFSGDKEWPAKLRLKAWLVQDGAEVTQGEALIELEED
jgi:biotin carboxyl carrier protein